MANKPGHEMTRAEKMDAHARHEAYAEQILDMYTRGESYRAIAAATGVPRATVHHMCKKLTADYVRQRYGDKTSILGRELAILDQLTKRNLPAAIRGDEGAARIVLASHLRRSKMLGLDAAIQAEISVKTAQDIEIERLVMTMRDTPEPEREPADES